MVQTLESKTHLSQDRRTEISFTLLRVKTACEFGQVQVTGSDSLLCERSL